MCTFDSVFLGKVVRDLCFSFFKQKMSFRDMSFKTDQKHKRHAEHGGKFYVKLYLDKYSNIIIHKRHNSNIAMLVIRYIKYLILKRVYLQCSYFNSI